MLVWIIITKMIKMMMVTKIKMHMNSSNIIITYILILTFTLLLAIQNVNSN